MKPLLEIKTTDIILGYRNNATKVEIKTNPAFCEIERQDGGLEISYQPGKLNYDTYMMRKSLGYMTPLDAFKKSASMAQQTAQMATARYAKEGNILRDSIGNKNIFSEISAQRMLQMPETQISFLPSDSVNFDWDPQEFSMKYEADKLRFDWKVSTPDFEVTPASIEFYVEQYPTVDIQYVGGAMYVPPSADPEYEPVKMNYVV